MIRNEGSRDAAGADAREGRGRHRAPWRFVLGVVSLAVVAGYVAYTAVLGSGRTTIAALVAGLGGCLSVTLIGEHVSGRFREVMLGYHLHPAVELLVAYGLVGVALLAVLDGHLVLAAVSGSMLVCSSAAVFAEDECFVDAS